MKGIGIVLICLGIIGSVAAFKMDTSVETGGQTVGSGIYSVTIPKNRVNNLGLMDDRRNYLGASGLAILVGVILFGFGSLQRTTPLVVGPNDQKTNKASEGFNAGETELPVVRDVAELKQRLINGKSLSGEEIRVLVAAAAQDRSILLATSRLNGNSLLHVTAKASMAMEVNALLILGADAKTPDGSGRKAYQLTSDPELAVRLKAAAA